MYLATLEQKSKSPTTILLSQPNSNPNSNSYPRIPISLIHGLYKRIYNLSQQSNRYLKYLPTYTIPNPVQPSFTRLYKMKKREMGRESLMGGGSVTLILHFSSSLSYTHTYYRDTYPTLLTMVKPSKKLLRSMYSRACVCACVGNLTMTTTMTFRGWVGDCEIREAMYICRKGKGVLSLGDVDWVGPQITYYTA